MKNTSLAMILACMLILLCACAPASAEVHLNQHAPEGWADRTDIVRVTQVDTNRSDCLFIEAFGKIMMVDGGYSSFVGHLEELLTEKGVTNLDWILNTHPHDDHIDGANVLMRHGWTTDVFLSPFPKDTDDEHQQGCVQILDRVGIPYQQISDGYQLLLRDENAVTPELQPGQILVLGDSMQPLSGLTLDLTVRTTGARDFNDGSALLILNYGDCRMLFMADLTRGAQQTFMQMLPAEELKADIIKAPHHGLTVFDVDFLEMTAPALVTIPNKVELKNEIASQCKRRKIPYIFSGAGDIIMETDGTDWYVWQIPQ